MTPPATHGDTARRLTGRRALDVVVVAAAAGELRGRPSLLAALRLRGERPPGGAEVG